MNGLTALLAAASLVVIAMGVLYVHRCGAASEKLFMTGFIAIVIASSLGLYGCLGRWGEWQDVRVDNDAASVLTARITQAQRKTANMPGNAMAHIELAQAYMHAGRYKEAVNAFDQALGIAGDSADVLGQKAYALYYRDGRQLTDEARAVIDRALALNRFEVQTLMLLGQDAFMHERWSEAIGYWKTLLDSGAAPEQESALRTAIANAEARAQKQD